MSSAAETIYVRTPVKVTLHIERDPSGLHVGYLREYPGIISQGRTSDAVRKKLVALLREIGRDHPEELHLFR